MDKKRHPAASFATIQTVYQGEVCWWWTEDKLHDNSYQIDLNDKVSAKVKELESKYDVQNDTRYCCQWEGCLLTGDSREQVEAATLELARYLAKFTGVQPLTL